jgi:hypothetical protein
MPRNALVWEDLQAASNWERRNAATKRLLWSAQGFSRIGRGGELLHDPTDGSCTHSIHLAQSTPQSFHGH